MANYDKTMADRVWKRVQGSRTEAPDRELNLKGLIMNEWMAASAYLQLTRQMPQSEAAVLRRLFREEQTHAACLKGMYILITGEKPVIQTPSPGKEPVEAALRRCYAGELQSIADYESRSDHPEYGHIFADMARQEREHSRMVLELIGRMEKGKCTGKTPSAAAEKE